MGEDGADPLFVQRRVRHAWVPAAAAYATAGQDARNGLAHSRGTADEGMENAFPRLPIVLAPWAGGPL